MPLNHHIILILLVGTLVLFHHRVFQNPDLLKHINFSYECCDRVITNCIRKDLQYERGVKGYLFRVCGDNSKESLKARTARLHENIQNLAKQNTIGIKTIKIGTNLLDIAKKDFQRQPIQENENTVVSIFKQLAYGNCWNFNTKKKRIERKVRRVYHYTVYHFDRDFGLGSHTINTYLPNTIRGYFNQHNWILQQLKRKHLFNDDIKMYYNSFQSIGDIDPINFQKICNSLTFEHIRDYDFIWIRKLWPELDAMLYDSYISELEYCSNIIFKQKAFLNQFYINRCMAAYELGLPEHLSFTFNRRIDRRYKNPLKTKLKIVESKPSLKYHYKKEQRKQYLKDKDMRDEVTINNSYDLGLKKQDFDGMRDAGREILERGMSIQQPVNPKWITKELGHNPFDHVMVKQKWIPGLKMSDDRLRSILKGFLQLNIAGLSMRELTDFVNNDLGLSENPLKLSQVSYVVRKLRAHRIVEKLDGRNRYRLTPDGHCFARMFVSVIDKVVFPFIDNVQKYSRETGASKKSRKKIDVRSTYLAKLSVLYSQLDDALHQLLEHVDIDVDPCLVMGT